MFKKVNYKGFDIEKDFYNKEFSVFYCGNDFIFNTLKDAKQFIDEITNS